MRKSSLFSLIILSFLLFSCTKESFSLSSSKLSRNITIDALERREEAVLTLSIAQEEGDESYSFLLVSPDGDLRWEGKLEEKGGFYTSPGLGITDGARFPEGEYTLYVYSSSGTDLASSLNLEKEEGNYTYSNAAAKDDAVITYYDSSGNEREEESEGGSALVSYSDRYSNSIKLRVPSDL